MHRQASRSALSGCRLAWLEALQQLPQLVGPGCALGERGHLDPERGRGLLGRRPRLALFIKGGLQLGDLLGACIERGLGMLGGVLGAVQIP